MESTPLVSIVTPSYNQAEFLEHTIQSVLQQDYPRLEYLVVDGGSTDGSVDTIRKYAGQLTWWISEKDQGQADAINKGLKRSHGEIVAWLNSDDYYLPGAISKAVAAFLAHPDVGLVHGDVLAVDEKGQTLKRLHYRDRGLQGLMTFRIIGQPAVFMRRVILEQVGYLDTSFHLLLDHHLWLRMASLSGMLYVPDLWAAARFHGTAKNVARAEEFGQEAYRIVEWMRNQPNLAIHYVSDEKFIRANAHRYNARYLLDGGKSFKALRAYWHSFLAHPAVALREWRRIIYAMLSMVGLRFLRRVYFHMRGSSLSYPDY